MPFCAQSLFPFAFHNFARVSRGARVLCRWKDEELQPLYIFEIWKSSMEIYDVQQPLL